MDALKDILDNMLGSLSEKLEVEQRKIDEIGQFQEVIRIIKNNPYILYTSDGDRYVKLLGLDEKKISTLKKIYDGYLLLGRDAIPQISLVEESNESIRENLEKKVCFLSDLIAQHQETVLVYEGYNGLSQELADDNCYVTQFGALRSLLESSDLPIEEQNRIKMEIIARNNALHKAKKVELEVKTEVEEQSESHYSKAINAMRNELENTFGEGSLKYLETLNDLLKNCRNADEVEEILSGWDYSLGVSYTEIIDGIITLRNIDILEIQDTFGEDDPEVKEEVSLINDQISVLISYKDSITLDREAVVVSPQLMNEYERAIYEYNPDPLSYPNHVFFLNNAVGRDIDGIRDRETLQDLFLLMENLKKGNVQPKTLSDTNAREIKPSKKGRQARIRYVTLGDNVCVVLQILERKSDKCRGEQQTLKIRQKEVVSFENELNNNPSIVEDLANVTRVHSDKLLSLITKTSSNKVGGVL